MDPNKIGGNIAFVGEQLKDDIYRSFDPGRELRPTRVEHILDAK